MMNRYYEETPRNHMITVPQSLFLEGFFLSNLFYVGRNSPLWHKINRYGVYIND